jgi:hypothetical protein
VTNWAEEISRARFWSKVDQSGGPEACWPWTGAVHPGRYGQSWFMGKKIRVHRKAFILTWGEISCELSVLHRCDNRICANPFHLFLGTQQDNLNDMKAKGRSSRGEQRWNAKLSERDVQIIREEYTPRRGVLSLAARFDISPRQLRRVAAGGNWGHVVRTE